MPFDSAFDVLFIYTWNVSLYLSITETPNAVGFEIPLMYDVSGIPPKGNPVEHIVFL